MEPKLIPYHILQSPLTFANKLLTRKYNNEEPKSPLIMIVGAPRTGSTITYQMMSHAFDTFYMSNYLELFFSSSYLMSFRYDKKIGQGHQSFTSDFGQTKGLSSPNEAENFWCQWFPHDRHYVARDELSARKKKSMKLAVTALINKYNKPFLCKNLSNGQRLAALYKVFPDMIVVHCVRNPLDTAISILDGKEKFKGDRKQWFGVKPENFQELSEKPVMQQIAEQIYFVEERVYQDAMKYGQKRYIQLDYDELLENPQMHMELLNEKLQHLGLDIKKQSIQVDQIRKSNKRSNILDDDRKLLMEEILKVNINFSPSCWSRYDIR
ncbi:sulfotransferase family protein [Pseudoalteromonas prydzensis]|uniref:Sulfotransferase n=1 Tax=Pseudoalteromonas prydzensis TaxID=182141 RepID=A0ABR9FP98_9GAMM|nr:sulfotransferase [Pseudoalteromonas prydzensis]MBE0458635.1 sulfotransferase [Pseudoalteromonas prydzensis]